MLLCLYSQKSAPIWAPHWSGFSRRFWNWPDCTTGKQWSCPWPSNITRLWPRWESRNQPTGPLTRNSSMGPNHIQPPAGYLSPEPHNQPIRSIRSVNPDQPTTQPPLGTSSLGDWSAAGGGRYRTSEERYPTPHWPVDRPTTFSV